MVLERPRQAPVGPCGLCEQNHARGSRVQAMMDKDRAPDVDLNLALETRSARILGLMSRQARRLVKGDDPFVLEKDGERFRFPILLRFEPGEVPNEDRWSAAQPQVRVALDLSADRDPSQPDGSSRRRPLHRPSQPLRQLASEPSIEGQACVRFYLHAEWPHPLLPSA